jgi:mannose/fructose/N-acetylgalactosamine-specific phosphotransferase system component IIB
VQVNQLVAILEGKIKEIQSKLFDADKVIGKIEKNISKSLEVANIFQDKIPHQEILERQYTKKYVKAAQLAHSGHSAEQIASVVELTRGEIELIVKLNKEQLQFEIDELPEWAKAEMADQEGQEMDFNVPSIYEARSEASPLRSLETAFEMPKVDNSNLKKLGDQFRSAMAQAPSKTVQAPTVETVPTQQASPYAPNTTAGRFQNTVQNSKQSSPLSEVKDSKLLNTFSQFFDTEPEQKTVSQPANQEQVIMQGGKKMTVKPFQFKRIDDANM